MRALKLLVVLLVLMTLWGCGHKPPIVQYRTIAVYPPDPLLEDCAIDEPPSPASYVELEWTDKEKVLIAYGQAGIKNTSVCNVDKKKLRDWKKEQKALYDKAEAKTP